MLQPDELQPALAGAESDGSLRAAAGLAARQPVPTDSRPAILVMVTDLLPPSQTFIRDHVTHVRAFRPVVVGTRRVEGLSLGDIPATVLPNSLFKRFLLFALGISPFLDRIVEQHGIVLIHAHFAQAGMRIARYARARRLPLVVTLHGADVLVPPQRKKLPREVFDAFLRRGMLRITSLFLPVSHFLERAAAERGYPAARLRMHVLGIPLHKAEPSRVQKRSEVPDILFVGRLVPKKGLSFLLRACSLLSERGYRYRLVIVGDGPLAEVHRAESSRLGVTAEFLGALPPPRVREQLASARIFAMPSTQASDGDNEGLPIVSLEAQAAELPIVAFAQGPVLEAVHDGVNGLLAPDKSVEGLAAALGALLDDEAMCRRMGAAGRAIVEEQFDVEARTGELEEIYRDLLVAEAVQRR